MNNNILGYQSYYKEKKFPFYTLFYSARPYRESTYTATGIDNNKKRYTNQGTISYKKNYVDYIYNYNFCHKNLTEKNFKLSLIEGKHKIDEEKIYSYVQYFEPFKDSKYQGLTFSNKWKEEDNKNKPNKKGLKK